MNKLFWLLAIVVIVNISGTIIAGEVPENKLVFTTPEKEGIFTRYQHEIFKEISKRTGFECTLEELPKKRGLVSANKGLYDGVAARIEGLEIEYPNLKMINVSHFTVQHILFARQSNIIETVHDMKSLTDYVIRTGSIVGFLRGSKKAQHLLSKLPKKNMFALNSPEKGFELLTKERIAFYLAGPGIVNKAILKEKYNHSGIQEICVLSETQLFPYVNVNHISIIPQLEAVLQSMLDDGTMGRIRNLLE